MAAASSFSQRARRRSSAGEEPEASQRLTSRRSATAPPCPVSDSGSNFSVYMYLSRAARDWPLGAPNTSTVHVTRSRPASSVAVPSAPASSACTNGAPHRASSIHRCARSLRAGSSNDKSACRPLVSSPAQPRVMSEAKLGSPNSIGAGAFGGAGAAGFAGGGAEAGGDAEVVPAKGLGLPAAAVAGSAPLLEGGAGGGATAGGAAKGLTFCAAGVGVVDGGATGSGAGIGAGGASTGTAALRGAASVKGLTLSNGSSSSSSNGFLSSLTAPPCGEDEVANGLLILRLRHAACNAARRSEAESESGVGRSVSQSQVYNPKLFTRRRLGKSCERLHVTLSINTILRVSFRNQSFKGPAAVKLITLPVNEGYQYASARVGPHRLRLHHAGDGLGSHMRRSAVHSAWRTRTRARAARRRR